MEQVTLTKREADVVPPYVTIDEPHLDLSEAASGKLKLSFSPSVWDTELFLVIDLYASSNPVHPAGHVGWWKWPLEIKGDLDVELFRSADGFFVTFNGETPHEFWKNPEYLGTDEPVIVLHVVLRPVVSEAVKFDDILNVYTAAAARDVSVIRRQQQDAPSAAAPSTPWFLWPRQSKAHLVATNIFEADAVGNFTLAVHRLLRASGVASQMYADNFDPGLRGTIRHTCELFATADDEDVTFVSYSIFDRWLSRLLDLPGKKVLYFHNITPPRFLQIYDAEYADQCAEGLAQLRDLGRFDAVMANSASSAHVLQELAEGDVKSARAEFGPAGGPFGEATRLLEKALDAWESQTRQPLAVITCPPMVGVKPWVHIPPEPIDLPSAKTLLLYVGRIAPHKRIEDLFRLFDCYRRLNPDSALAIVGAGRFEGYSGFLRYLLNGEYAALADHIYFHERVSDAQLKTLYQRSSALVTMSEHEGFCLPVVEAMALDRPVFAYADEAVVETLGQSGRVFRSKDFPAIAADIHAVLTTPWLGRLIVDAQRRRLEQLTGMSSGNTLWKVFEKVLFRESAV